MPYSMKEASELIPASGLEMIASGMAARTWGNISARLTDGRFLITPSGIPYDRVTADMLVAVSPEDLSWSGDVRPSSEKAAHAAVYRARPQADFVLHTHQPAASAMSLSGNPLVCPEDKKDLFPGGIIPCAPYGLSGSEELTAHIAGTLKNFPEAEVILLRSHGTLIAGRTKEEAFARAEALEEMSRRVLDLADIYGHWQEVYPSIVPKRPPVLGKSCRKGKIMAFMAPDRTRPDKPRFYDLTKDEGDLPPEAALHREIYRAHPTLRSVVHVTDPEVIAVSTSGKSLPASLDDMAQLIGPSVPAFSLEGSAGKKIAAALGKTPAVLIRNAGALCAGNSRGDTDALKAVLKKACLAALYDETLPQHHRLSRINAMKQRKKYLTAYAPLASAAGSAPEGEQSSCSEEVPEQS